jgi:hypothetical protein
MTYIPIFVKIGTGVKAKIWFFLRNLRGCNIGITDGRDFLSIPLRLAQLP